MRGELGSRSLCCEHPIDPCARGGALLLPTGDLANEMFAFADAEPLRGASRTLTPPRGDGFWLPCRDAVTPKGP